MHADTSAQPPPSGRPRCVLMTADTVGGVWDYSLQLCRGLAAHDTAVTLATMGPAPTADQRSAAAAIGGLTLVSRNFRLEWMEDPWADVDRAGEWLLDLESEIGADIVHLNGYAQAALPWSAPVLVAAHSCVCSWWQAVHGEPAPSSWDQYRDRVRSGLRAADAVVAPTRAMLAALATHYGPLPGFVIPNGRSQAEFRPAAKAPVVCSAGRLWDEAKHVRLLASAAPDLPWPVYVAGDTHRPGRLAGGGNGWSLPRNLRPLGRLPSSDLRTLLSRSSIFALPAKYEPFGLTALEAALSGCALVLGDIPSLRETWDGAAWFVGPSDREGLVDAIRSLAADDTLRVTLADRARQRAAGLSAERMVGAYLEIYVSLRRTPVSLTAEGAPCAS